MDAERKQLDKFTLAAIGLICLAVLYFAYNFIMGIKEPPTSYNYGLGQFKTVSADTIGAIKGLNACGTWPIKGVNASTDRGNPFSRKGSAAPNITAVASPYCLPVTQ